MVSKCSLFKNDFIFYSAHKMQSSRKVNGNRWAVCGVLNIHICKHIRHTYVCAMSLERQHEHLYNSLASRLLLLLMLHQFRLLQLEKTFVISHFYRIDPAFSLDLVAGLSEPGATQGGRLYPFMSNLEFLIENGIHNFGIHNFSKNISFNVIFFYFHVLKNLLLIWQPFSERKIFVKGRILASLRQLSHSC